MKLKKMRSGTVVRAFLKSSPNDSLPLENRPTGGEMSRGGACSNLVNAAALGVWVAEEGDWTDGKEMDCSRIKLLAPCSRLHRTMPPVDTRAH